MISSRSIRRMVSTPLAALLSSATLVVLSSPAYGFTAPSELQTGLTLQYAFGANFNNLWGEVGRNTVRTAFHKWGENGGSYYMPMQESLSTPGNYWVWVDLTASGQPPYDQGTLAQFSCQGGCHIEFNQNVGPWHTQSTSVQTNWYDLWTIAGHEMGHALGLHHSGPCLQPPSCPQQNSDHPASDPVRPVMHASVSPSEMRRTPRQDDHNGLHTARPRARVMTYNDSFEYSSPFGMMYLNGGTKTRMCSGGGALNTACFVRTSGGSIAQDVWNRSYDTTIQARVRARASTTGRQIQIVIWNLNGSASLRASQVCTLPSTNAWTECATPWIVQDVATRIEVYNLSGGTIDVDTLILGF